MRDLDWQFGISNLAGDFNRNFFGTRESVRKIDFFREIKIRKISDIFAINYSEKKSGPSVIFEKSDSFENRHLNYRVSIVITFFHNYIKQFSSETT